MATVPRAYLNNYDGALNDIRKRASDELRASLALVDYSAGPDSVRDAVLAIMQACCGGASQMAAAESAIFYDGLRERVVGSTMGTSIQDKRSAEGTDRAAKALLKTLFDDDDEDLFIEKCVERLDYEITAAAGRCMQYNAQNDPERPRYARIPQGDRTCDFCLMLASRGPVYHTAESAGAFEKFHLHCDCKIMPFWGSERVVTERGGVVRRGGTSYEGYDPDAYFNQYLNIATERFRARMERAADKAHAERGTGWRQKLSNKDMTTIRDYISGATSYEDLIKRVDKVDNSPYFMSDKQWNTILQWARDKRKVLINADK